MLTPEVIELGLSAAGRPLPCGLEACRPFEEGCIQPHEQSPHLARVSCGHLISSSILARDVRKGREENALSQRLIQRLSIDSRTGIFTYNTQLILFERMVETGVLEVMQQKGYSVEMLVFDLDKLKLHNELGDHEGGNVAIAKAVQCLQPLFRRQGDLVGYREFEAETREAIRTGKTMGQLGRFETGDELIGISWNPPPKRGDRRRPGMYLDRRQEQIAAALEGAEAVYELRTGKSAATIAEEFPLRFDYTIDEVGMVHAPVSGTFALALAPVPASLADFDRLFVDIDGAMGRAKASRSSIVTGGVWLNLLRG